MAVAVAVAVAGGSAAVRRRDHYYHCEGLHLPSAKEGLPTKIDDSLFSGNPHSACMSMQTRGSHNVEFQGQSLCITGLVGETVQAFSYCIQPSHNKYRFEACSSCPDVPQLSGSPKMVNAHALRVVRGYSGSGSDLRTDMPWLIADNRNASLKPTLNSSGPGLGLVPALFPTDLRSADSWRMMFGRC